MKAIRAHVSGHVQGVGYRQGCRRAARALDLVGWVRNLDDGRVEVLAQGGDEAVDRLIAWVWAGPPGARIMGVESEVVAVDNTLSDFFIQPNPAPSQRDHLPPAP